MILTDGWREEVEEKVVQEESVATEEKGKWKDDRVMDIEGGCEVGFGSDAGKTEKDGVGRGCTFVVVEIERECM